MLGDCGMDEISSAVVRVGCTASLRQIVDELIREIVRLDETQGDHFFVVVDNFRVVGDKVTFGSHVVPLLDVGRESKSPRLTSALQVPECCDLSHVN